MKWIQEETKFERKALSSLYFSAIIVLFIFQISGAVNFLTFFLLAFVKIITQNFDWSPWVLLYSVVFLLTILVKRLVIDPLGIGADGGFVKDWFKYVMLVFVLGQIAYYYNTTFCNLGPMPKFVPEQIAEILGGNLDTGIIGATGCREETKEYFNGDIWKYLIPAIWNLGPLAFLMYSKKKGE